MKAVVVAVLALAWFAAPAQAQSVNLLTNASFEQGSARGWSAYGGGPIDIGSLATPGIAREGAGVGVAQASSAGASMVQDVGVAVQANRSYSLSLWVKSADGQPIKGTLAVAGILNTETEATGSAFTAGADWKLVTAELNTRRVHDALRAQIYVDTTGRRLLVDGAQLFDTGLNNSSFELGDLSGWAVDGTAGVVPLPDAKDGANVAVVTAPQAARSLYQD